MIGYFAVATYVLGFISSPIDGNGMWCCGICFVFQRDIKAKAAMNEWDKSIKYATKAKFCVEIKGKRHDSCELNGQCENKGAITWSMVPNLCFHMITQYFHTEFSDCSLRLELEKLNGMKMMRGKHVRLVYTYSMFSAHLLFALVFVFGTLKFRKSQCLRLHFANGYVRK